MSHSCGLNKPLNSPYKSFLSCVIVIYFSPFFFDHPVLVLICKSAHYFDCTIDRIALSANILEALLEELPLYLEMVLVVPLYQIKY